MIVVTVQMWPQGAQDRARVLTVGTLALIGQALRDEGDVRKGERLYRVRLYKDTAFGGPEEVPAEGDRRVWREGWVRGHFPGPRGVWDLLGGALRHVLDSRIAGYAGDGQPLSQEQVTEMAHGARRRGLEDAAVLCDQQAQVCRYAALPENALSVEDMQKNTTRAFTSEQLARQIRALMEET